MLRKAEVTVLANLREELRFGSISPSDRDSSRERRAPYDAAALPLFLQYPAMHEQILFVGFHIRRVRDDLCHYFHESSHEACLSLSVLFFIREPLYWHQ
jgi:hypothetical protein